MYIFVLWRFRVAIIQLYKAILENPLQLTSAFVMQQFGLSTHILKAKQRIAVVAAAHVFAAR